MKTTRPRIAAALAALPLIAALTLGTAAPANAYTPTGTCTTSKVAIHQGLCNHPIYYKGPKAVVGSKVSITGTKTVGSTLTAKGTYAKGSTLKYQWYSNNVAIPRATGSTVKLSSVHAGKEIRVRVLESKPGQKHPFWHTAAVTTAKR